MERSKVVASEIQNKLDDFRAANSIQRPVTCQRCFRAIYPRGETDSVIVQGCKGFYRTQKGVRCDYSSGCVLLSEENFNDRA